MDVLLAGFALGAAITATLSKLYAAAFIAIMAIAICVYQYRKKLFVIIKRLYGESTNEVVTYRQIEHLWELLNKNRNLVNGQNRSFLGKEVSQRLWEEVATALNADIGGAVKDWKSWKKYWHSYKSRLKKLASRVNNVSRENTMNSIADTKKLTELELKFLQLLEVEFVTESSPVEPVLQAETPSDDSSSDSILNGSNNQHIATNFEPQPGPSHMLTPPQPSTSTPIQTRRSARFPRHMPSTPGLTNLNLPHAVNNLRRRARHISVNATRRALIKEAQKQTQIQKQILDLWRDLLKENEHITEVLIPDDVNLNCFKIKFKTQKTPQ